MRCPVCLLVTVLATQVLTLPNPAAAKPASRISIEWATANSDRAIVGKVIKVETADGHDIVTVEIQRTLRGDQAPKDGKSNPRLTFITQKYCSGFAQGWLKEKQAMVFFLVKKQGANDADSLPKGFEWVLHDNGMRNSAVILGKTDPIVSGTMDAFTRKFDHLTDPAEIVKYVTDYAKFIPAARVEMSETIDVPHDTSAYRRVFPPKYPSNTFYLRVPVVGRQCCQVDAKHSSARGWRFSAEKSALHQSAEKSGGLKTEYITDPPPASPSLRKNRGGTKGDGHGTGTFVIDAASARITRHRFLFVRQRRRGDGTTGGDLP